MSKILYIVRHAKSPRDKMQLRDWERPLAEEGIVRANKVSNILRKKKICPDKIISSHALRALNTAVTFALNLDYPVNNIEISPDIYEKSISVLLNLIKKQDNKISSLMIFGHNPYFTELYNYLSGEEIDSLSTSAVACILFEGDSWDKIDKKKGKSVFIETGKPDED